MPESEPKTKEKKHLGYQDEKSVRLCGFGPSMADIRAQLNAYTQAGLCRAREFLQRALMTVGQAGEEASATEKWSPTTSSNCASWRSRQRPRWPGLYSAAGRRRRLAADRPLVPLRLPWAARGHPADIHPVRRAAGPGLPPAKLQITTNSFERGAAGRRHRMTGPHRCHIGPVLCGPM
jgi:hypothetical protein